MVLFAAALTLAACSKKVEVESGGNIDTTTRVLVPQIDVRLKTDTVNVPKLGTVRDTVVIDRPVVKGRKPVEVARPTFEKQPPQKP
jgi:hypothetical protein